MSVADSTSSHPGRADTIGFAWTEPRIELLKQLWADGLSASQIAAELGGITRNAAMGKISRLGLQHHDRSAAMKRLAKSRPARTKPRKKRLRVIPFNAPEFVTDLDIEAETNMDDLAISMGQRKTLMQLENEHCRYPIDDGQERFFCGHPSADLANDKPYCAGHSKRCYAGRPEPRKPYIPARNAGL